MVSNWWVLDESWVAKFIYEFQCRIIHCWICSTPESWYRSNCLNCRPFDFIGEWEEVKTNFGVGLRFSENNDLGIMLTRIQNLVKHQRWNFLKPVNYFRKKLNHRCLTRFWIRLLLLSCQARILYSFLLQLDVEITVDIPV